MNRIFRLAMRSIIPAVYLLFSAGLAATYYVDTSGNDGLDGRSISTAWRYLSKVNEMTFAPGDTLLFRSGETWNGILKPKGSGDAGIPIYMCKFGGAARPVITGGQSGVFVPQGPTYASIMLYNIEYWVIDSMEVTNFGAGRDYERSGIWIYNDCGQARRGITVKNCYVHDVRSRMFDNFSRIWAGIQINTKELFSSLHDITIEGNTISRCPYTAGIYCASINPATRNDNYYNHEVRDYNGNYLVRNNYLYEIGLDGIQIGYASDILVEGNTIIGASTHDSAVIAAESNLPNGNPWTVGLWTVYSRNVLIQYNENAYSRSGGDAEGIDIDKWTDSVFVQYNYFHDNSLGDLNFCSENEGYSGSNIFIRYNIFARNGQGPGINTPWGYCDPFVVRGNMSPTVFVHNNVFFITYPREIFSSTWGNTNGGNFFNNVFYNATSLSLSWRTAENPSTYYQNYNCYYGPGSSDWPGGDNTIRQDPLFTFTATGVDSFRIQDISPLRDKGVNPVGFSGVDFWMNTVPSGAIDIGACEAAPSYTDTIHHAIHCVRNTDEPVIGIVKSKEHLILTYAVHSNSLVHISLVEPLGKTAGVLVNRAHNAGIYRRIFTTNTLSPGVYIILMRQNEKAVIDKISLLH